MKHMVDKVTALQDELNAYKNKTMVLSQEADAEIQGLQQQLSKYKKTSPANKADTPLNTLKKHYRRASYVQRLNNDVDSLHQSRYHHCNDACLMTVTATMVCSWQFFFWQFLCCGNSFLGLPDNSPPDYALPDNSLPDNSLPDNSLPDHFSSRQGLIAEHQAKGENMLQDIRTLSTTNEELYASLAAKELECTT